MLHKRISLIIMCTFLIALFTTGCGPQSQLSTTPTTTKKVIKVGSATSFPPFEFQDEKTQEYIGFDIDLAKAVFKQAGYDTQIISVNFDGLIPALLANNIDAIVSGMQITDERSKKVLFSNPYFDSGQNILIKTANNSISNWNDLEGKHIGVQIGTTGAAEAKKIPNAIIHEFDSTADANLDLIAGGVEAVVNSVPVNAYYLKNGGGDKYTKMVGEPRRALYCGIAVNQNNKQLADKINKALDELKANGEYDRIYEKWFGKRQK